MAEARPNHHPDIFINYTLPRDVHLPSTHDAGGVHRKGFCSGRRGSKRAFKSPQRLDGCDFGRRGFSASLTMTRFA